MSSNSALINGERTDYKQADLALLGMRLRDTLDSIREAVFQLDRDRRCMFLNAAWTELTGQCISETLDFAFERFFFEDDRPAVVNLIAQSLERDLSDAAEVRLLKRDGSSLWVELRARVVRDELGAAIGVSGTLLDIHARREAQSQLRASENLFRTAFDLSPNGIAIVNTEARFTQCNRAMCELFGQSHEELLSKDFYSLIQAEDVSHAKKGVRRAQAGKTTHGVELRGHTKDGRSIWIEMAASQLSTEAGAAPLVLVQLQDLSEHKRIETDLQSQNQILFHAKGMLEAQKHDLDLQTEEMRRAIQAAETLSNAKTDLLADVSEQLRAQISSIISLSESLSSSGMLPSTGAERLHAITQKGRHVLAVADGMLDLAKVEAGRLKLDGAEFALKAVADDVLALMQPIAAQKNIQLVSERVDFDSISVRGDAARLRQILLQLIANAVARASNPNVNVRLATEPSPIKGRQLLTMAVADGELPPEQTHSITPTCEPAKASTPEVTSGLLLTNRLLELLGGSLEVVRTSRGHACLIARVSMELAQIAEMSPVSAPAPQRSASVGEYPRLSGRVLVAEPVRDDQKLLGVILRRLGVDVVFADDEATMLEALRQSHKSGSPLDLVLANAIFANAELFDELSAHGPQQPRPAVLAIASPSDHVEIDRAKSAGCVDVLTKPLDAKAVIGPLTRLLPAVRPENASEDADTLQREIVSSARSDYGLREHIARFVHELPTVVASLVDALSKADSDTLLVLMSRLKISATRLGFESITASAAAAEASIKLAADRHDVEQSVLDVIRMVRRVQGYGKNSSLAA